MGGSSSKLEKALLEFPEGERYFGFENFGNTCYANSVLQSLYFCRPFRDRLLQYAASLPKDAEDNLLTCLADLFVQASQPQCLQCMKSCFLQTIAAVTFRHVFLHADTHTKEKDRRTGTKALCAETQKGQ